MIFDIKIREKYCVWSYFCIFAVEIQVENLLKIEYDMNINRDIYLKRLIDSRHNRMIKVVTGVRRCGKSYLLFHLFTEWLIAEGVADDHIITVNLEDRRNKSLRDPDNLLEYIDGRMMDKEMYYILLDEIQMVNEFEDVLNSYLNVDNADVYVTGSNAKFLSKDVITEFRGRGDEIHMLPLSFGEFFSVYDGDYKMALDEYLTYGGLPQIFCKYPYWLRAAALSPLWY